MKDRNRERTKAANAPYVPSRVVRDGAFDEWSAVFCQDKRTSAPINP